MQRYFVDAWYFIALIDIRDAHHAAAARIGTRVPDRLRITHEAVLTEVLSYFADDSYQRMVAGRTVRRALSDLTVVTVDRPLFLAALDRFEARPDKEYSHVDCMSMVLMEQRGIRYVITNDRHFAQAGFTVVSE